jgi:hypothetical protein
LEFVWGVDCISEQKREACRALVAGAWHAHNSPDAPPLPVHVSDIHDAKKGGGLSHLLAYFAQSLACDEWRLSGHPPFETYARRVLAAPLQRVRGKIEFDGLERVTTQTLLDMLEVPQRGRTAGTYRRLAKLMAELDWMAVRVRDLTRGGYTEQVRGYVRAARNERRC